MTMQTVLRASRRLALLASLTLATSACGDDGGSPSDDVGTDTSPDATADATPDTVDASEDADDVEPDVPPPPNPDCDPLSSADCAMPWPSNLYLEADSSRATGFTLAFGETTLPANFQGTHIAPDDYRRLDGYGVSTPILVHFPNLDISGLANDLDVEPSLNDDAPVLLFAVRDGDVLERVPYFAELDAWEEDPALQILFVRPAVILEEATRYIVAFRDTLRDTSGEPYAPSEAFAALLSGDTEDTPTLGGRQERFDDTFALLESAGIEPSSLLLAWDFNTASSEALHGRMLEMREEGFAAAGEDGPPITITEWTDYTEEENEHWAAVVRGYLTVPHFMREDVISDRSGSVTGWTFNEDGDGLVSQNGTRDAEFWIGVPHSAMDGTPHGLVQYGHGFFGLGDGTTGRWTPHGTLANEGHYIFFGGNWTGMAEPDFGNIQFAVFELTRFRWLPDRSHQGVLEFLLFPRSMTERFPELDEVTSRGIVVDPDRVYFEGISQGGILGGTYMALSRDVTRGHLAVPGQNYTLIAHRSRNFDEFFVALAGAYPGRARQAVLLATVQTLWDMIDPASYYRHLFEDPFEGDPERQVLITPSLGDYSVNPLTMEIVARTFPDEVPVLGEYAPERAALPMTGSATLPHTGSGMVFYSWPNLRREAGYNKPIARGDDDPHNDQRWLPNHQEQMLHFFETGEIMDACGGDACSPD